MFEFDKSIHQSRSSAGSGHNRFDQIPAPAIATWHKLVFILFLVAAAVNVALVALKIDAASTGGWPEGSFLSLAVGTTLLGLARFLPWQNVLMAAVIILCSSGIILLVDAVSGVPFGPIIYSEALGDTIFNAVPWSLPLFWVVIIINGRGVARLIMRAWRNTKYYGFWLIGVASLLTVILDFGLEPFAVHGKGYWLWRTPKSVLNWYTAPWINFLGWFTVTVAILLFTVPWLINKQPVKQPADYRPLVIWWVVNLWLMVGNAVHHLWPAVAFSLAANGVVTALVARGARCEVKRGGPIHLHWP